MASPLSRLPSAPASHPPSSQPGTQSVPSTPLRLPSAPASLLCSLPAPSLPALSSWIGGCGIKGSGIGSSTRHITGHSRYSIRAQLGHCPVLARGTHSGSQAVRPVAYPFQCDTHRRSLVLFSLQSHSILVDPIALGAFCLRPSCIDPQPCFLQTSIDH